MSGTVRVGDTVRREAGPWTPTVHAVWRLPASRPAEVVCLNDLTPDNLVHAGGRDLAPARPAVLSAMRDRLHELADLTDRHADRTDRPEQHEHARTHRHDAAHLPAG